MFCKILPIPQLNLNLNLKLNLNLNLIYTPSQLSNFQALSPSPRDPAAPAVGAYAGGPRIRFDHAALRNRAAHPAAGFGCTHGGEPPHRPRLLLRHGTQATEFVRQHRGAPDRDPNTCCEDSGLLDQFCTICLIQCFKTESIYPWIPMDLDSEVSASVPVLGLLSG